MQKRAEKANFLGAFLHLDDLLSGKIYALVISTRSLP
jgi:hypothetical protein